MKRYDHRNGYLRPSLALEDGQRREDDHAIDQRYRDISRHALGRDPPHGGVALGGAALGARAVVEPDEADILQIMEGSQERDSHQHAVDQRRRAEADGYR